MISRVKGVLLHRDIDRVEVETASGLVYEIEVPLTVAGRLPSAGSPVEIRTVYVVREDSASLYGFLEPRERELFIRLLGASGVGAKLALSMLSTFTASRLARALVERDLPALTQVSGVGKKTAERISLELGDRVKDLAVGADAEGAVPAAAQEAVAALVALGYTFTDADEAVRGALEDGGGADGTEALVRRALSRG